MPICPVDGSEMKEVGSHGIVDWDGRWDAQATKFECSNEKAPHTVFVIDYEPDEWGATAFQAAYSAICAALRGAIWTFGGSNGAVRLKKADKTMTDALTTLDDLRHQLATWAVEAFKAEVAKTPEPAPGEQADEYEYIHAIEDVDEVLEEFEMEMEELKWQKRK